MGEIRWTESQTRAITASGGSVLVSAGAGSGKTAVLAERCVHFIADARPPCAANRLLVVTFTEAAAAQMRDRIAAALRGRLETAPSNERLRRQLALIDTAAISTIHAFCKRTLDRHFAHAGLDPATSVMDAHDAMLMRRETARAVFDRFGERDDRLGRAFDGFVSAYAPVGESRLHDQVLAIDNFLSSLPDPDAWIADARSRLSGGSADGLSEPWVGLLIDRLRGELDEQSSFVRRQLGGMAGKSPSLAGHVACLTEYQTAIAGWRAHVQAQASPAGVDAVCESIRAFEFPAIPRMGKKIDALPPAEGAAYQAASIGLRGIRKRLLAERLQDAYARFSTSEWADGIERIGGHASTLLDLVAAFRQRYRQAKSDVGVLDFSDLERRMLDLLRAEDNGVAARLRDRYEHVLVDEYQDVNPIQAEIIRRVSREHDAGRPDNLFAVGDVKQSIYRFRLAEPRLFLDRMRNAQRRPPHDVAGEDVARVAIPPGRRPSNEPQGVVIDLVENFRSARGVIDAINTLFERLMAEDMSGVSYDDHARLVHGGAESGAAGRGPACELHILERAPTIDSPDDSASGAAFDWERIEREAYVVARRILDLASSGVSFGDMVVLLRSMAHRGPLFVRTLARLGVPVFADVPGGFLDSLEIRDMLSLLGLLDNQQQDIPLAAVLRSPLFGEPLADSELVEIRVSASSRAFNRAVVGYARDGRHPALRSRLSGLLTRLGVWRQQVRRRPLADVIWEIYESTGYPAHVSGLPDGAQRRANLIGLHDRARRFGEFGRHGLYRFLRFVEDLAEAETDLEPGHVAASADDVVRVMSIHRSKGLEFPVVIAAELGKQFNLSDARGSILFDRSLGLGLEAVDVERRVTYPTLPHRLVAHAVRSESLAEELRVLYVALTRAKERLVLVGTGSLSGVDERREQYSGHDGVIPLLDRQTAASMLDWLVAAVCCQAPDVATFHAGANAAGSASLFAVRMYGADEIDDWVVEPPSRQGVKERLDRCARFEPIAPDSVGPDAAAVVEKANRRLTSAYPAIALTRVPAVAAASELKRRWMLNADEAEPAESWPRVVASGGGVGSLERRFDLPAIMGGQDGSIAAARGTAVHTFLELVELRRPCDEPDLCEQLSGMLQRGVLTAEEARSIDMGAIAWFFGTTLGSRLRERDTRVHREWPFVTGVAPRHYEPSAVALASGDLMLVRGIVDCVFDAGQGWEVLDYKTDRVDAPALQHRVELYRGQLDIYANAVELTWGKPVGRRWLAFLTARQIVEC